MTKVIDLNELVPMPSIPVDAILQHEGVFYVAAPLVPKLLSEIRSEAFKAGLELAAQENEKLAELREQGAGDSPPGHRLRQSARYIRDYKKQV